MNDEIDMGCYEYYTPVITPDSPTNFTITVQTDSITHISNLILNWDTMPNANSYLIYNSDNPFTEFSYLTTVSESNWNTELDAETKKFYYVVASSDELKAVKPVKPVAMKIKIKKIENMLR